MRPLPEKNICAILVTMDAFEKLALISQQTALESADEAPGGDDTPRRGGGGGATPPPPPGRFGADPMSAQLSVRNREIPIHMVAMPGGRRIPMIKAMLTTACERDCLYCPFRARRDFRRLTFKPEELASTFHAIYHRGTVDGIFLSTGIFAGGANTQNKLLDAAEVLRWRLGYRGYLHLKIMPGAERGQVLRAMSLADRVSVNLEAPNEGRLRLLAPHKQFTEELLQPLRWVEEFRRTLPAHRGWRARWPSTSTQFVVGAAGENDLEILDTVCHLFQSVGLSRAYFEAFSPVEKTPLENHPAENPLRQQRLYEASYLLRDYGFDLEDMPFGDSGLLPLDVDPKRAYAEIALRQAPVDLNLAERPELLRVPGIGPGAAEVILRARRERRLRDLGQLKRLGIQIHRAAPFIVLDGRRPPQQLNLLPAA
jgi:predicted DNA-binding helix-hairpin-helix protein